MKKECDEAQFLKDVKTHTMTVCLDQGGYRHLQFRKAGENRWHMWFELMAWPNALEIRGDMGTWSFSRIEDMFEFFRSRPDSDRGRLYINPSYWSEKLEAEDRVAPHRQFDIDVFKAAIFDTLDNYDLTRKKKAEIRHELTERVFNESDETLLRSELDKFEHDGFHFSEVWEISGQAYTYRFLWCLYAIVWGIQQYDLQKKKQTAGQTA